MKLYSVTELETELKKLDPRLTVEPNPNRPGLSNVKLDGRDIIPCPSGEIREESDPSYYYMFPNGMQARHKSYTEIIDRVKSVLELIKTDEGKEVFFDK